MSNIEHPEQHKQCAGDIQPHMSSDERAKHIRDIERNSGIQHSLFPHAQTHEHDHICPKCGKVAECCTDVLMCMGRFNVTCDACAGITSNTMGK